MTTQQDERAELIAALEEYAKDDDYTRKDGTTGTTVRALAMRKAAALLADGESGREPFCWAQITSGGIYVSHEPDAQYKIPLYTRPQQAAQVAQPLAKEGVLDIADSGKQSLQLIFKSREAADLFRLRYWKDQA